MTEAKVKITALEIDEGSFVDAGDNPQAKITMFKRAPTVTISDPWSPGAKAHITHPVPVADQSQPPEAEASNQGDNVTEVKKDLSNLTDEQKAEVQALIDAAVAAAMASKTEPEVEPEAKMEHPEKEEEKKMDEVTQKALKETGERLAKAEAELAKMREQAAHGERVAKLRALGVSEADDMAKALRQAELAGVGEAFLKTITGHAEQVRKAQSVLLQTRGGVGAADSSGGVWAEVTKRAREIRKTSPQMTEQQARAQAINADADLKARLFLGEEEAAA